jgi:prepilin-type N-terminal cleavage/methylation domain-containing protein
MLLKLNFLRVLKEKGFTLIEIMIAVAIVGAVITVILYTVNYHADIVYQHTVLTRMYLIAKENLIKMESDPKTSHGIIQGTDFSYRNKVYVTEDENILKLKTEISGYGKTISLTKLVFRKKDKKQ